MQALPPPATSSSQAEQDLREYGLCVLHDVLDAKTLNTTRQALYAAADTDRHRGREVAEFGLDRNQHNQRVWNLLSRNPVFSDLAEHEVALHLVKATLGWPALLSNISANIADPGAVCGVLHADQIFVPQPWPATPQGLNVAWCLDDVTVDNGATEVAIGSHRWNRPPTADDVETPKVVLAAPAGSAIVFESRLWHRSGANTTASRRAMVFAFYTTPIYRTQENWFLSLAPQELRHASDTLKTLLAYKSEGFGLVFGESPQ